MRRLLLGGAAALTASAGVLAAAGSVTIKQKNRAFSSPSVIVTPGEMLRFTNDDDFPHQIYVNSPDFTFDSDAQQPGSTVEFSIPKSGSYRVLCGIHPRMRLDVEVR